MDGWIEGEQKRKKRDSKAYRGMSQKLKRRRERQKQENRGVNKKNNCKGQQRNVVKE